MEDITVTHDGPVAILTLDRPPVNAVGSRTLEELREAFDAISASRQTAAVVLTSSGGRAFCAGADLADSRERHRTDGRTVDGGEQGDPRNQLDPGRLARDCFWAIYDCAVPVIAAVNGKAIGAGAALVACCDFVIASDNTSFALTEVNVGVLGGAKFIQRLAGPFLAKRMLLTGDFVSAEEFYRRGSIESIVPEDSVLPEAVKLGQYLATKSPIAVRLGKESANRVEFLDLKDGYRLEQDYTVRVRRYTDADEAQRAYLEKRQPQFKWA